MGHFSEEIRKRHEEYKQEENFLMVAFPKIGCGRAGGDWDQYFSKIRTFARENPHLKVTVCELSPEEDSRRNPKRKPGFGREPMQVEDLHLPSPCAPHSPFAAYTDCSREAV